MKTKAIITVAIIIIGAIATVAFNGLGSNATQYRSEGIVVDFGDYYTIWTNADFKTDDDPVNLLDKVKETHIEGSFDYTMTDGLLTDVKYEDVDYSNTDKNKAGNETEASGKVWGVGGSTKGEVSSEEDNTTTTTNTIPILYHHIACSAGPGPYLECYDTQFHEVKNDSTTGKWTCCNGLNNLPKKY